MREAWVGQYNDSIESRDIINFDLVTQNSNSIYYGSSVTHCH